MPIYEYQMKKMEKHFYETPVTEVIIVAQVDLICVSETGTDGIPAFNGFGKEETW